MPEALPDGARALRFALQALSVPRVMATTIPVIARSAAASARRRTPAIDNERGTARVSPQLAPTASAPSRAGSIAVGQDGRSWVIAESQTGRANEVVSASLRRRRSARRDLGGRWE